MRRVGGCASMAAVQPMIEVDGVEKSYGERAALRGVSFAVSSGEIVGLLGPNGAGKSTAMSILATILASDRGHVRICGHALPAQAPAARAAIGYVPQRESLYPTLTARENLLFFARIFGLSRDASRDACERSLAGVGLEDRGNEPIAHFSVGMRRRLNLACGILHGPRVVLLDEPTVGVDPQSRERIFDLVRALAARGAAILYSTHAMDEAERLCGRVVLLDEGRVIASGTPEELVSQAGLRTMLRLRVTPPLAAGWSASCAGILRVEDGGDETRVELSEPGAVPSVLLAAGAHGGEIEELHFHRPDLADVFFALTGRALRDQGQEHSAP